MKLHWKRQLIPVLLGLGVGMVLAWALTRDSTGEVRRDIASTAVALARKLPASPAMSPIELDAALGTASRSSATPIAWIQLRQADSTVIAQTGIEEKAAFTLQYVKAQHAIRKAAVKVVQRAEGRVLVESQTSRSGRRFSRGRGTAMSRRTPRKRRFKHLWEIGLRRQARQEWAQQRRVQRY